MNEKIYKLLFSTGVVRNKIRWLCDRKKFRSVGNNFSIGKDYSFKNEQYISIGDDFTGGRNVKIHAWVVDNNQPVIDIGNDVTITDNCYISACNKVVIKDGVLLGVNAFVTDNQHGEISSNEISIAPNKRRITSKGPVVIGKNVWIGRNVCIMPNVVIGEGVIVGANSVVTHDIPSYCVAVGAPAKVIKEIGHDNSNN